MANTRDLYQQMQEDVANKFNQIGSIFREKFKKNLVIDQPAGQSVGTNALMKVKANLSENKISLNDVKQDALVFNRFLTVSSTIRREKNNITESSTNLTELKQSGVDAIVVFGNNDLNQIQHVATLYKKLKPRKIFVSGKGGHGTSPGPIFGNTEAETMGRLLQELGVPKEVIVEEKEATNSGQNITFVSKMIADEKERPYKNILISGTPAGILRQLRSFEVQSPYAWENISTLPPTEDVLSQQYYGDQNHTLINLLCSLREVGSFLDYTINTKYMSSRPVSDEKAMRAAVEAFIKYYNLLHNEQVNAHEFTELFVQAINQKAKGEIEPALKAKIGPTSRALADYFRFMFNMVEQNDMRKLPQVSIMKQSQMIDFRKTYARLGLDSCSMFKLKEKAVCESPVFKRRSLTAGA